MAWEFMAKSQKGPIGPGYVQTSTVAELKNTAVIYETPVSC